MDDTLGARLGHCIATAGITFEDVDALAGLKSRGHTGQIVRGERADPQGSTLVRIARVLGTSAEYLVDGSGDAPGERRVRRAVAEARLRLGGAHTSKVAPRAAPRKGQRQRSGSPSDRSIRAGGASR